MDILALQHFLTSLNQPAYRFRQIVKNYYSGRYSSFSLMTDISKDLRLQLADHIALSSVTESRLQASPDSQKAVLTLADGHQIETVLMDYGDWSTACVSSQVGCPLGCAFCATGKMGFIRDLTSEEIVDQVIYWNHQLYPKYIGRIVYMGMGEPFLNWSNVKQSLSVLMDKDALNIGQRKISLSTAGIAPQIRLFADFDTQINLAISLHSADQAVRQSIMPIASTYPLSDLTSALEYYVSKTRRQVFFEYALINQVNDTPQQLSKLISFIKSNRLFYLNIIPLNQIKGGLSPSSPAVFKNFIDGLTQARIDFSVRRSIGQSISSACGQLIVEKTV